MVPALVRAVPLGSHERAQVNVAFCLGMAVPSSLAGCAASLDALFLRLAAGR